MDFKTFVFVVAWNEEDGGGRRNTPLNPLISEFRINGGISSQDEDIRIHCTIQG
jgi:hypothetical protein